MGFLVIDRYNDLWLGGRLHSSSGDFCNTGFNCIFSCASGISCLLSPLFDVSKGCRVKELFLLAFSLFLRGKTALRISFLSQFM